VTQENYFEAISWKQRTVALTQIIMSESTSGKAQILSLFYTEALSLIRYSQENVKVLESWNDRETYNHQLTCHRVPVELWTAIFYLCTTGDASDGDLDPLFISSLSHVCRLWRGITLQYSSLWRNINLSLMSPSGIEEFIRRSRESHLCISNGENDLMTARHFEFIHENISRVRELNIHIISSLRRKSAHHTFLTEHYPSLVDLSLHYVQTLPLSILVQFAGVTPALRTVILSGVSVNWATWRPRNLTHLHLSNLNFNSNIRIFGISNR